MYGLILENLAGFVKHKWGEGKWEAIRKNANIETYSFSIHHVYAETVISRLTRSAAEILGITEAEFLEEMGNYFIEFVGQYGYDQVMSVLGRFMRHFLNGLDSLHEYLKFSYPKMRAPSFYCTDETRNGLILHYRSRRRGFIPYTIGIIKEVGKHFYGINVGIEILDEEMDNDTIHVRFQLTFNNRAFAEEESLKVFRKSEEQLPIKAALIFELFPFAFTFSDDMIVKQAGYKMKNTIKEIIGQGFTETFELLRPTMNLNFQNILSRRNNVFECVSVAPLNEDEWVSDDESGTENNNFLKIRGQMIYMDDWNLILYLAKPAVKDLDALLNVGLYLNDLTLHNMSRDLVLRGTQQSVQLKIALAQEQDKSKKLEESMKKVDAERKRSDELLYQMIPKQVAEKMRSGEENMIDTCQVYESVSVLFSQVTDFTEMSSRIQPMMVVTMLNYMYSLFDQLSDLNGVYKVETTGDAYMVVSGAPVIETNHIEKICDMALDMMDASDAIKDPIFDDGKTAIRLKVGIHTGSIVAGIVGIKSPRFCLFGDTVNIASRMESTAEGGKIQISQTIKEVLPSMYQLEFRGKVLCKGKGELETYYLLSRNKRIPLDQLEMSTFSWAEPQIFSHDMALQMAGGGRIMSASGKSTSQMSQEGGVDIDLDRIDVTQEAANVVDIDATKKSVDRAMKIRKKAEENLKKEGYSPMEGMTPRDGRSISGPSGPSGDHLEVKVTEPPGRRGSGSNETGSEDEDSKGDGESRADDFFENALDTLEEFDDTSDLDDVLKKREKLAADAEAEKNGDDQKLSKFMSKKEEVLKKMRRHKMGLAAEKAMIQMGCPGFGDREKNGTVVSKACNLL